MKNGIVQLRSLATLHRYCRADQGLALLRGNLQQQDRLRLPAF